QRCLRVNLVAEDKDLAEWLIYHFKAPTTTNGKRPPLTGDSVAMLDQLDEYWSDTNKAVLGDLMGSELVGRVRLRRSDAKAAIPAFDLAIEELEFQEDEFLVIRSELERTGRLYERLGVIHPAVTAFNSGIFRHQSEEESHAFIHSTLSSFRRRIDVLYRDYGLALNKFGQDFEATDMSKIRQLVAQTRQCSLRLKELENTSSKKALDRKKQEIWTNWLKAIGNIDVVEYQGDRKVDKLGIANLQDELASYLRKSEEYDRNRRRRLREAAVGLSQETLADDSPLKAELARLNRERLQLIEDLNDSGLYQLPVKEDAATSLRQYKSLESIIQQLDRGFSLLEQYSPAYRWQQNWFSLRPPTRRIIRTLMPLPPKEWLILFEAWYLDRAWHLRANSHLMLPGIDERMSLAEAVDERRYYPFSFRLPKIFVAGEEPEMDEAAIVVRCFWRLPDDGFTSEDHGGRGLFFSLLPNRAGRGLYVAMTGPTLPASLALLQPSKHRELPKWSIKSAWPDLEEHTLSFGKAPVSFRGTWPRSLAEWSSEETGKNPICIFLGKPPYSSKEFFRLFEQVSRSRPINLAFDWSERDITQFLLEDGFEPSFLAAAMIRAAQAAESNDHFAFEAIAEECRQRLGVTKPIDHPLVLALCKHLPSGSYSINEAWRSSFLPLLIRSASTGVKTVVLVDGRLPGEASAVEEILRQSELKAAGFQLYDLPAYRAISSWIEVVQEVVKLAE
ncbi:MAG: hypothetical protein AAF544_01135, partial [Bacteroidota bacterium]